MARDALIAATGWEDAAVVLAPMVAAGDRIQDRSLAEVGGKALWTRELDRALLAGEIDCAVHSMKDVETIRPPEIAIAAILERADPRDRLVGAASIAALAPRATVGTSSPRREAQLRHKRPDLSIVLFRGNVATRLAKLEAGEADATLLAAAGLDRLGLSEIGVALAIDEFLPAPAQGAIGIETLTAREDVRRALLLIDHPDSATCVFAERRVLAELGGSCHSPVAAYARLRDTGMIVLSVELYSEDGAERIAGEYMLDDAANAPEALARDLLGEAPASIRALFSGPA